MEQFKEPNLEPTPETPTFPREQVHLSLPSLERLANELKGNRPDQEKHNFELTESPDGSGFTVRTKVAETFVAKINPDSGVALTDEELNHVIHGLIIEGRDE